MQTLNFKTKINCNKNCSFDVDFVVSKMKYFKRKTATETELVNDIRLVDT